MDQSNDNNLQNNENQNQQIDIKPFCKYYKSDIEKCYKEKLNYFLPQFTTVQFFLQHKENKKLLLKNDEVIRVTDVPHFQELSVKKLWPAVKNDGYFNQYFPDYPDSMLPDKNYFYNVMNTAKRFCIQNAINNARTQRRQQNMDQENMGVDDIHNSSDLTKELIIALQNFGPKKRISKQTDSNRIYRKKYERKNVYQPNFNKP